MMRIAGAEAAQDNTLVIGVKVSVGVSQVQQLRTATDIKAAIPMFKAGWDEQAIRENGGFIGAATSSCILKDNNLVIRLLSWLQLGINRAARDPEAALRVETHLDRLGQAFDF